MMMMAVPGHPESCCRLLLFAVAVTLVEVGAADGDLNADEVEVQVVVGVQDVSKHLGGSMHQWPPLSVWSHQLSACN